MQTLIELQHCTVSAKEVEFNDELQQLLGQSANIGKENAQFISVYVFRYLSQGHKIAGFLVTPKQHDGPLPVIVYNRGGTKDFGIIKQGMLFKQIAELVRWGYVVIGSQLPGNSLSEEQEDWGEQSVQAILDLYPIIEALSMADQNHVGIYGESRGGAMTYMSLVRSNWVKAAVTLAGAANLIRGAVLRPEMQTVYEEAFGGGEEGKKARSAVYWPKKFPENVPLLLLHGTADRRVSPLDSIDLASKLYEQKKPFQLVMYDGGDHGLSQYTNDWQAQAKTWFDKHLKSIVAS